MSIFIKHIYEPEEERDGYRVPADRIRPRGFSREKASWNERLTEAAPSTKMRRQLSHDPDKREGFRKKYFEELERNTDAVLHPRQRGRQGKPALPCGAGHMESPGAAALKDYFPQRVSR